MAESNKAVISAICANVVVATLKMIAAGVTGSSAMLSEGIHSLVDTGDSVLLYVGIRLSKRPPDRRHPLGHGRELYFWSMVVAMIIFGAGACVNVYEGISRILHPQPSGNLIWSYSVLGGAALFDGISLFISIRQFRKESGPRGFFAKVRRSKDPSTFAVIFEDGSDLLGITAAFLGIWLGDQLHMPELDGVASVVIGLILGGVAFLLGRECHGLLIGEGADEEMLGRIAEAARICSGVEEVGNPLTLYFGPHDIMVALSVLFRSDLNAKELAETIDRMETSIRNAVPDVKRIFVEAQTRLDGQGRVPNRPAQGNTAEYAAISQEEK